MSTLYLVRHGITAANRENRFAGRSAERLLPEGIEQIQEVGEQLLHKNIDKIYCGPAQRTRQSAEIIGVLLKAPVLSLANFDEIYLPHWDGLTKDEIRKRFGDQYPVWLAAPQSFQVPGCETLSMVQTRAARGVELLFSEDPQQNLLLVSHLIVLRCLVLYFRGRGLDEFRSVNIANGAIIRISGIAEQKVSAEYLQE